MKREFFDVFAGAAPSLSWSLPTLAPGRANMSTTKSRTSAVSMQRWTPAAANRWTVIDMKKD